MHERDIFRAALAIEGDASRRDYLATACAGDDDLLRRVETLLHAHEGARLFLERPFLAATAGPTREIGPDEGSGAGGEAGPGTDPTLDCLEPSARPGSLGRLGHYEVLEVLGRGGFGTVVRAFDEKLHRMVAIKVMARGLAATSPPRKRFLREARAAAAVRHENVVGIHAVEEHPVPYLVMEYVAGPTLQDVLDRSGPIDAPDVLRIGRQVAEGLAAAHRRGLVHRDIKPANILLEDGVDRVKITDFGLARAADDASLTQSGFIAGTPLYMAPEQASGAPIDRRADLFSLGSVLYVMCTGRPPFRAPSTLAVLRRVAEDSPRPIREVIPEIPAGLCDLVESLHAKDPADRPGSADEVAARLHALLESPPGAAPPPLPPESDPEFWAADETFATKYQPTSRPRPIRWAKVRAATLPIAAPLVVVLALAFIAQIPSVSSFLAEVGDAVFGRGRVLVTISDPELAFDPDLRFSAEGETGSFVHPRRGGMAFFRLKAGRYTFSASKGGRTLGRREFTVEPDATQSLRIPVARPRPESAATFDLGAWGIMVAPARGSHATIDGNRLTLAMPADAPNDLNPSPGRSLDAPRVLQTVAGDFLYRVRLLPPDWPGDDPRVARGGTYNWSGLVVWAGERDFLRFGISRNTHHEAGMPLLNVQSYRDGRDTERDNIFAPLGPTWLQVERRGGELAFRTSEDGQSWSHHKTLSIAGLPVRLRVGVGAINTGFGAFAASFEDGSLASPNPPASAPSGTAAPASGPDLGPWGRLVDPRGGVRAARVGDRLSIALPADAPRDLNPVADPGSNLDAPRALRPVEGDFAVEVGVMPVATPIPVQLGDEVRHGYHYAGLIVWAGERDFLRFGVSKNGGPEADRPRLDFEFFRDHGRKGGIVRYTADVPVRLRAERRGDTLFLRTSPDGRAWADFKAVDLAGMPTRVLVGVGGINTGLRAFEARFEGWSLRPIGPTTPEAAADAPTRLGLVDPLGGSRISLDDGRIVLALPGGASRDLDPGPNGNLNAPRYLRPLAGDFTARVAIPPLPRPRPEASRTKDGNTFLWAGLVAWAGGRDFVRLGVGRSSVGGDARPKVHLESFRDGKPVQTRSAWAPAGTTHLQMQRRGDTLTVEYSLDGRSFMSLGPVDLVGLPASLDVGVAAINTGSDPVDLAFDGWSVGPEVPPY